MNQDELLQKAERYLPGACLGMMLACRPSAIVITVVATTWLTLRSRRHGLLVMLGAVLGFAPWAILYESLYGMGLDGSSANAVTRLSMSVG